MPRVETYDEQRVQEAGVPGVTVSYAPSGETALGRGLSNLASIVDKRAQEMQDEEDAAALTQAQAAAADKLRPILHDDILTRRGSDAFSAMDDAGKAYDEIGKEVEAGLRNDRLREAFRRDWLRRRENGLNTVSRHVASERQTYRAGAAEAGAKSALEDVAADYGNPDALKEHMARGKAAILANLHGQPKELVAQRLQAFESDAHAAVIDRLAVSNPGAAQAYYQGHKDQIDGLTQARVEKVLESQTLRAESQAKADEIVGSGKSITDQLKDARAIKDPKLRDETARRVQDRYNETQAIERQIKADLVDKAGKIILQGGTTDDLSPEQVAALGVNGYSSVLRYVRDRAAGKSQPDYTARYFELQQMATREPEKFAQHDLVTDLGDVSPKQIAELYTLQRSIKKGDTKDLVLGRTKDQIITGALESVGITTTGKRGGSRKKMAAKSDAFRRWVEEQAQAEGLDKNDKDWRERLQKIVDRGLIEGQYKADPGFFGPPDKYYFEGGAGEFRPDKDQADRFQELTGPTTPQTQAEYDALPSGSVYRDPDDGKLYRKP